MDGFGKFRDVYHAYSAMNQFCDSLENGCDECRYALISEMSDVPCCFFWILENVMGKKAEPLLDNVKTNADSLSKIGEALTNRILTSFGALMDLESGRKPGESISDYQMRKANTLRTADKVVGDIENKLTGANNNEDYDE